MSLPPSHRLSEHRLLGHIFEKPDVSNVQGNVENRNKSSAEENDKKKQISPEFQEALKNPERLEALIKNRVQAKQDQAEADVSKLVRRAQKITTEVERVNEDNRQASAKGDLAAEAALGPGGLFLNQEKTKVNRIDPALATNAPRARPIESKSSASTGADLAQAQKKIKEVAANEGGTTGLEGSRNERAANGNA